jgi:hypothetical protein
MSCFVASSLSLAETLDTAVLLLEEGRKNLARIAFKAKLSYSPRAYGLIR